VERRAVYWTDGELIAVGIASRLALLFRAKANKAIDRAEDPRDVLDYSYQRQLEMLTQVRRGLADVATSGRRLDLQANQLQQSADKLHDQASQALEVGREDIAREALNRRAAALDQLAELGPQRESLRTDEQKLTLAAQRLQTKVESFRSRKETVKATYTAAEAQTRINESVAGISEEMGDVGLAMQRAEDKTAQMQARSQALDGLLSSGALDDVTTLSGRNDDIQKELDSARGGSQVELELAQMKRQLSGPSRAEAVVGRPGQTAPVPVEGSESPPAVQNPPATDQTDNQQEGGGRG
jgi:phage shock protein A